MSDTSRKPYDSCRISSKKRTKVYEKMLLKELTGSNKSNQPMHAVLESSLEYERKGGMKESQRVRNHALIHYLASLANSNNFEDKFDFDFVESLINNGADINSTDKSGQTIFHEVARSWNSDVASFLIEHGADLNKQDIFGRSPLHVASAVDYADMVQFLVKSGADINIATYGEGQMPIHYAAKNDSCNSLKMLLGYGADIDSRDAKNRTPLQLAAEMSRANSAKLLVQNGAPAGVNDRMGNSALALLIEKIPDVAVDALDQFHSVSTINRKEYFFLNYLEGNRLKDPESPAYSALEIAVQNHEFKVILHPVMKRLICIKWQKFGRYGALSDLGFNLIYVILWSVLAVTTPAHGRDIYFPLKTHAWRLIISVFVCLMTLDEIRKQLTGIMRSRRKQMKWISWRVKEMQEELQYCHPRWPQEEMFLNSEIEAVQDTPLISTSDVWIYYDWFSLVLILGTIASHLTYVNTDSDMSHIVYLRIITLLLLVLWFRILKYARPFEGAGPFVVIFAHVARDILNWGLLLCVIAIPFVCAFSITFGEISAKPVKGYSSISPLLYNMFSMVVVSDHHYESLEDANPTMARILCGTFIGIMAIVCLNILIALLSDTFSRVYSNAVANAMMQRAKTILLIEKSLGKKKRRAYEEFIKNKGSPETVDLQRDISFKSNVDDNKSSGILKDYLKDMHGLLNERLGKRYGKDQMSDFDILRDSVVGIQNTMGQEKIDMKQVRYNLLQTQNILIKLSQYHNVDLSDIDYPPDLNEDSTLPIPTVNASRRKSLILKKSKFDQKRPLFHDTKKPSFLTKPGNINDKGFLNKGYQADRDSISKNTSHNSALSFDADEEQLQKTHRPDQKNQMDEYEQESFNSQSSNSTSNVEDSSEKEQPELFQDPGMGSDEEIPKIMEKVGDKENNKKRKNNSTSMIKSSLQRPYKYVTRHDDGEEVKQPQQRQPRFETPYQRQDENYSRTPKGQEDENYRYKRVKEFLRSNIQQDELETSFYPTESRDHSSRRHLPKLGKESKPVQKYKRENDVCETDVKQPRKQRQSKGHARHYTDVYSDDEVILSHDRSSTRPRYSNVDSQSSKSVGF